MTERIAIWTFDALCPELRLIPLELPREAGTLDEVSSILPGGAYTTLRTYAGNKALRLEDHFTRLRRTAQLAGKPLPLDESVLRLALRQAVQKFWEAVEPGTNQPADELRLRLTIDLEVQPGRAYIAAEPLTVPPSDLYRIGAAAVTRRMNRHLPEAKLTRFIERSREVRQSLPASVNEAVMINPQEELAEGLSSNFFAILDGRVRTAATGVLEGVTRSIVLDGIRALGLEAVFEPVRLEDLPALEEAFLTSSSRGVLPVCRIDQFVIGIGTPGAITRKIMGAFSDSIRVLAMPL